MMLVTFLFISAKYYDNKCHYMCYFTAPDGDMFYVLMCIRCFFNILISGGATKHVPIDNAAFSKFHDADNMNSKSPESETLSDIEDLEVCNFLSLQLLTPVFFSYCSVFF